MNLLARYLLKEILAACSFVFLGLVLLFFFFDLASELSRMGRGGYGFGHVTLFVLLSVPGHIYEIVPIAALIGSLFALSRLVMNSELSVMLASGVSNWRIAQILVLGGLIFALFAFAIGELVSPWSEQAAQNVKLRATESVVAQSFRSGLWVKDGNTFINAREVLPDAGLRGLRVYEFNDDWELSSIVAADKGVWLSKQQWEITGVSDTKLTSEGISLTRQNSRNWKSVLNPDILSVLLIAPEKMAMPALVNYIQHLRENKQKTTRYEAALWSKLFYPLAIPVIMLLALPFAFNSPRSGSISVKVFLGILAGLAFHLSNRLFAYVGLLNDWPPFITAAAPSLVFLAIALFALKRLEAR